MVKTKKFRLSGGKLFPARLSALICLCLVVVALAACGDVAATAAPLPTVAPTNTAAPVPTTAPRTTAAAPTAAFGNPASGVTPAARGGATTPGGTALAGIPDEIKKPFALISTDLQKRTNLPATSFQVAGFTMETFPDSAMGCPDPNLMYTQVLTPGYRIQVIAGGKNYDYRTNLAGTRIILCGGNGRPAPAP